jgi:glycine reductase complex component B subunit alpha and beta
VTGTTRVTRPPFPTRHDSSALPPSRSGERTAGAGSRKLMTVRRGSGSEPLELASFEVAEVVEGSATSLSDASLTVCLADLSEVAREGLSALADLSVRVVRPGDPVRIAHVLDAIIPDVKATEPEVTFPGALGRLALAGNGRTNRLTGVGVLSVCDWSASGLAAPESFPDAFVDMAGPGRSLTAWGDRAELVVTCTPKSGASVADVDRCVRKAALRVALGAARATIDRPPAAADTFELADAADPKLPRIAVILQVASEGPLADTFLYGREVAGMVPTLLDHREVLDGALTNGAYDWAAVRNVTASYQENALIRSLVAGHGKSLGFSGVILALGYLDTPFDKERSAMLSARLARQLGADGVICTTFSSGNSHTDTMLTVRACETLDIRAVAIVAETNDGLTDHVPEADSIISTGNHDEWIDPWLPDEVIGTSDRAMAGEPVPVWAYLGACAQTGDMALTAVSA